MEEQEKSRTWWIVLLIILGLLISCGIGAVAGGALGYMAGRRAARVNVPIQPRMPTQPQMPRQPQVPTPRIPNIPNIPSLPGGQWAAVVTEVVQGGPAARAGIRVGDVIVSLDGERLSSGEELAAAIAGHNPGDSIKLGILRQGRERTVDVKLGRNPDKPGEVAWLGIYYQTMPSLGVPRGGN